MSTSAHSPTTRTFLKKFLAASKAEGEQTWQMPMDEEYKEALKSSFADLHNIGGRAGGLHHRGLVPARFREANALDPPRHRRHRLAGRCQAVHGQRPIRRGRAYVRPPGDELVRYQNANFVMDRA